MGEARQETVLGIVFLCVGLSMVITNAIIFGWLFGIAGLPLVGIGGFYLLKDVKRK